MRAADATVEAINDGADHVVSILYAHDDVRTALRGLFHGKCAYCESRIAVTAPWDVDHYRPKGRVAERPDHPGYYWLAYEWNNLLPSCQMCNRRFIDPPSPDDPTRGRTAGKVDQFPLFDESRRAMGPSDPLDEERPLLLDPCTDDPEVHITFGMDGHAVAISASQRGVATIDICHLDRKALRDARRNWAELLVQLVSHIAAGDTDIVTFLGHLRDTCGANNREFAGLVRAICRDPAAFGLTTDPPQ